MDKIRNFLLILGYFGCFWVEAQGGNLNSKNCCREQKDITIPLVPIFTDADKRSWLPEILQENKNCVPIDPLSQQWRQVIHVLALEESWENEMRLLEDIGKAEENLGHFDRALLYHWKAGVEQFWPNSLQEVIRLMDLHFDGRKTRQNLLGMLSHYPKSLEELRKTKLKIDKYFEDEVNICEDPPKKESSFFPSAQLVPPTSPSERSDSGDSSEARELLLHRKKTE